MALGRVVGNYVRRGLSVFTPNVTQPSRAPTQSDMIGGPYAQYSKPPMPLIPSDKQSIYKAVIPMWLYKPAFGKPRNTNLPEVRRLAKTPHIAACIETIIDEVTSLPWEIVPKDEDNFSQEHVDEVTEFLQDPNLNHENFKIILRQLVQDILEIDSGVLVKIFSRDSYIEDEESGFWFLKPIGQRTLTGIKAYDGMNFTANPDAYGMLPDHLAYWQYSWATYQSPVGFDKDEIVYMMKYPQTNSGVYGRSDVEILMDIAQALLYSVDWLKEFYSNSTIPEGVLSIVGADEDVISAFKAQWSAQMIHTDEFGNKRRSFHDPPILNTDVKWTPFTVNPRDIQMLETQQWWWKIVQAVMSVTPSELGFTEDVNRSTDLNQSEVFKRKAVKPLIELLEFHVNTQILPEFTYDDVEFIFIQKDIVDERRRKEIAWQEVRLGMMTPNEYRAKYGETEDEKEPIEGGDVPKGSGGDEGGDIGRGLDEAVSELNPDKENSENTMGKSYEDAFIDWERNLNKKSRSLVGKANGDSVLSECADVNCTLEDHKAMTTETGGATTSGSALIPVYLENKLTNLIRLWVQEKLDVIQNDVTRQKDVIPKALDFSIFTKMINRITDFLTPTPQMKVEVYEVVDEAYNEVHDDVEKRLDMNIQIDPRKLNAMKEMVFNDVVGMTDDIAKNLRRSLYDGIQSQESIKDLSARIKSIFEVNDTRAKMIAVTTMTKVNNEARVNAYKDSGVIDKVQWQTRKDNKVCKICKALEDKVFPLGKSPRPVIDTHPLCRCILLPYFEE